MRSIPFADIVDAVAQLCRQGCTRLPADVLDSLRTANTKETSDLGRDMLRQCIENAELARRENIPMCQDTGIAVFFVQRGADVRIDGGLLFDAISRGTARGYTEGYLRKSIVADPVFDRKNTTDNTPPVVHIEEVPGDALRITFAPKGAGSENMSALAMLKPSAGRAGIVKFVVESVVGAGGNPCPPTIVGVGIGGSFETAARLAKRALLRPVGQPHPDQRYAHLETDILTAINASGVGPQGLGGTCTALSVHIEHHPCHIASLPVAVNLNCHAARHAEVVL